ncbi:DUF1835 domain-containing protein [Sinomicrobium weinanense]|uniref:DUF1835 domain-containing protein n=1 Tax=Sinomicrobium weinanense TaxID=2842200 RepID=A0A926JS25_9FLAO|nr:DUF1835 domain-containing protein [Sinomicrobium weinanense]MBC9796324.1 DUF1835 domain-containing protein [Sinomicrobium weinanense]MBU3122474.1 DUF1835 domain-containing protein [Sinomicrobium weinanense]
MTTTLHITNGDGFTSHLKELKLEGEIITWREMLCEGRTMTEVGSESFWKARFEFLNKNYKISKTNFIEATLKEYRRLCNQKSQEEIVLWFDEDLFCQINMIAVVSWLKKHRKGAQISLVCGKKKGNKSFILTNHTKQQLLKLYDSRTQLTQDDIEYADYIWQLYCSDTPLRLETFSKFNASQFPYLTDAIALHLHRFPTVKNGLNHLENSTLEIAAGRKIVSREKFVETLIKNESNYGFGDLQYLRIINSIKPLFKSFNPVKLSPMGKDVLNKVQNYYPFIKRDDIYLGGTQKYSFLYHEDTARLLKL